MAFLDDVLDLITAEVTFIGLSHNGSTEYGGEGYVHLAPNYSPASGGAAPLSNAPLQFNGDPNAGPITHLIFKRETATPGTHEAWVTRALPAGGISFNSDGRLDINQATITQAFVA
jgi:hypothetical protein